VDVQRQFANRYQMRVCAEGNHAYVPFSASNKINLYYLMFSFFVFCLHWKVQICEVYRHEIQVHYLLWENNFTVISWEQGNLLLILNLTAVQINMQAFVIFSVIINE